MCIKINELNGFTKCFGYRLHDGGSTGLITLYIEDDECYFPKMTFDRYWLNDFNNLLLKIKTEINEKELNEIS